MSGLLYVVFSLYPNEIDKAKTSDILKGMLKLHASLHITHLRQVDDTSTTSRCWDEGNKDFNWRSTQKLWVASCFLSITCAVCHNQKWCLIGKRATSFQLAVKICIKWGYVCYEGNCTSDACEWLRK